MEEVISRREVRIEKNFARGLECTDQAASARTEGKVFLDTDRPRPGNNIFIFLLSFTSGKCMKNRRVNQECFYCGA